MSTLKEVPRWCILLALLIIAIFPLQGVPSTEEFKLNKSTEPAYLQLLINQKKDSEDLAWLGADAATSVEITPDRYVWLFGDTILGKEDEGRRKYSVFIHNTIGVMERDEDGNFTVIEKSHRKEDGKIEPIFTSQKEDLFYWPLVGTRVDSSLLVFASKVSTKDTKTFEILGTTIFTVENPMDPPEYWIYESKFLPKKNDITWGSAVVKRGEWIYLFGQKGKGLSSKSVLTRIGYSQAAKDKWGERLNFVDGEWKANSTPEPIEGLPGTSETTIQYNSFFGWYCLQIPPLSFDVHLYTADSITGPWRDQGVVYTVPSPWSAEKTDNGKHVFSAYAAKSHPELAKAKDEIIFTYNTNLNPFVSGLKGKLQKYIEKKKYEDLYVPQFVSLEFQKKKYG